MACRNKAVYGNSSFPPKNPDYESCMNFKSIYLFTKESRSFPIRNQCCPAGRPSTLISRPAALDSRTNAPSLS